MTIEELKKLKLLIEEELNTGKKIDNNVNIKKVNKRNYIEYRNNAFNNKELNEKEESSSGEDELKDKKGNIVLKVRKKLNI